MAGQEFEFKADFGEDIDFGDKQGGYYSIFAAREWGEYPVYLDDQQLLSLTLALVEKLQIVLESVDNTVISNLQICAVENRGRRANDEDVNLYCLLVLGRALKFERDKRERTPRKTDSASA